MLASTGDVVAVNGPTIFSVTVTQLEVIAEFRRLELIAEEHARVNDSFGRAGVQDAELALRPWHSRLSIIARLRLNSGLNSALFGVPPIEDCRRHPWPRARRWMSAARRLESADRRPSVQSWRPRSTPAPLGRRGVPCACCGTGRNWCASRSISERWSETRMRRTERPSSLPAWPNHRLGCWECSSWSSSAAGSRWSGTTASTYRLIGPSFRIMSALARASP